MSPQVDLEASSSKSAPVEAHGFKLVREQFVSEYNSLVLMYRHEKTGEPPLYLPQELAQQ
jgi:hypothetical protein